MTRCDKSQIYLLKLTNWWKFYIVANANPGETMATRSTRGKGVFSFWGSALQVFGQCGGASMRTKFWQNYFLGRKGFAKTSADFPPAGGSGEALQRRVKIRAGFGFLF